MAIETICKGCAKKLRVGDEYAGRKARCPHCKTVYTVPKSVDSDNPFAGIGESTSASTSQGSDQWFVRTSDGTTYGPASKSELDGWLKEGRLDAKSEVRQGTDANWQSASSVYPSLRPTTASQDNPFATQPTINTSSTNPYSSPQSTGQPHIQPMGASGRPYQPHRGATILIFGILGFACCQLFSVAAWIMGHTDMQAINAGRMDPSGKGLTQAGMIIGMIGTGLMVLTIAAQILIGVFSVVVG